MDTPLELDRRTLLAGIAGAGSTALAGCSMLGGGTDADSDTATLAEDRARELAERYAPTLYFDAGERWFPTDPRPYETDRDGEPVVDGFAAFNGYTKAFREAGTPPNPMVFYHAVEYVDSPLAVVQFWLYSAFDQFTTNFHWHDWEALQVFVDTETDDPQLYVASSHSRRVPNNEFLDPEPGTVPHVLSELGSHSSALSVNDDRDTFHRLPDGSLLADITNSTVDGIEALAQLPIAYGLPRGEGFRLPFVLPELDDDPLYEHPDLPDVSREDLLPDRFVVSSFEDITSPPDDLPARATGTVFVPPGRATERDQRVTYDLAPTTDVEHITAFTGPQLSFEFTVPQFAEDAMAGHLTTTGEPWNQPRYEAPAADITDVNHRRALADRYAVIGEPGQIRTIVASISDVLTDADAPEESGVTTEQATVEGVALLESDPTAVPTFNGVAVVQDVPPGDHRFTVNRAGTAPHSETVTVPDDADGPPVSAGVDGEIPLVAREHATKLEVDTDGTDAVLTDVAIDDDFGGRLYEAPVDGRDAVYVHRGGAYTTEVRDSDDAVGAHRVSPGPDDERVRIEAPDTGTAALASFVADVSAETKADIEALLDGDETDSTDRGGTDENGRSNSVGGLATALGAVADAARRAADRANADDRENASQALDTVQQRLETVTNRLQDAEGDLPDDWYRATDRRMANAKRRTDQADRSEKL